MLILKSCTIKTNVAEHHIFEAMNETSNDYLRTRLTGFGHTT